MSVMEDVTTAVVTEVNTGSYSEAFTAQRYYQPVFSLPDMSTLHVSVVPKSILLEASSRSDQQYEVAIDIAVQKKIPGALATQLANVDTLMDVVEEIMDLLRMGGSLPTYTAAQWVSIENTPIYDDEHLDTMRQFSSVITVIYKVWR